MSIPDSSSYCRRCLCLNNRLYRAVLMSAFGCPHATPATFDLRRRRLRFSIFLITHFRILLAQLPPNGTQERWTLKSLRLNGTMSSSNSHDTSSCLTAGISATGIRYHRALRSSQITAIFDTGKTKILYPISIKQRIVTQTTQGAMTGIQTGLMKN